MFKEDQQNRRKYDKVLYALSHHLHLKSLQCGYLTVTRFCLSTLQHSKWWKELKTFKIRTERKEKFQTETEKQLKIALQNLGMNSGLTNFSFYDGEFEFYSQDVHNLIVGPSGVKLKAITLHGFPSDDHFASSTFEARKETLEESTLDCDYFEENCSEQLVLCTKIREFYLFCSFEYLDFLPQLQNLKTLSLDMHITWESPYKNLPPNSLPNLTKLVMRMVVPGEVLKTHLKSKEQDTQNSESFVVSIVQSSPKLTVFDLHSDDECVTENTFDCVITSCPELERIRFHLTRDRFYRRGKRKRVNLNFASVDCYTTTVCNKLSRLQLLDVKGWTLSDRNLEMIVDKCSKTLTALRCNGQLYLKSPTSESMSYFNCWETRFSNCKPDYKRIIKTFT